MRVLKVVSVLALAMAVGPAAFAVDASLGSYANALVTNLGGVIGVAIGAGFAIFALWMGFRYVKAAIRGH